MNLGDYTVSLRYRDDWGCWEAEVSEFFAMKAAAGTREEALAELERLYRERVLYLEAAGKPLPVPGEDPEPMFSTSARIDAQAAMARDFFSRVLGLDYDEIFVSDATRLSEFGDPAVILERALGIYGVDARVPEGLDERPLWEVLGVIRGK
ncbi:MAG TPA: hypothetical protein VNT60_03950 [Deinococcales bacterium]|nr:hypothetical protein [Deinococcales bacterium]